MSFRALPNYLKELAQVELNEDVDHIADYLHEVRKWVKEQPYLIVNSNEDQWIVTFLRCCKYDLEETKKRIDFFFCTKSITPEYFENKDPLLPIIQTIVNQGCCFPIKSNNGPTKILIIWRRVDPNIITFTDMFKYGLMLFDVLLDKDDDFVVFGQEILHDMRDFPIDLLKLMTPVMAKKSMLTILNAYPTRIKRICFFNSPPTQELFSKLFEPFLSQEIKNTVSIHKGGLDDVYREIPLTDFPKEYGGEGPDIEEMIAKWKIKFEAYRPQFIEEHQFRSDEAKREGGPKTSADVYNIEDSFGKLDID